MLHIAPVQNNRNFLCSRLPLIRSKLVLTCTAAPVPPIQLRNADPVHPYATSSFHSVRACWFCERNATSSFHSVRACNATHQCASTHWHGFLFMCRYGQPSRADPERTSESVGTVVGLLAPGRRPAKLGWKAASAACAVRSFSFRKRGGGRRNA